MPSVATNTLFTDQRTFTDVISPFSTSAATGQVTIALSRFNTTGRIRKPLIVIEGYDAWRIISPNRPFSNYAWEDFADDQIFGGLDVRTINGNNFSPTFNDILDDASYDIVFLDFDNGVDYMQRNAFLVERLIEWVNGQKALAGSAEQNVVMGMSMGGLIARYALRDMEVRRAADPSLPAHDTRLYISHDSPHQGANVPLGFQHLVKSLNGLEFLGGRLSLRDLNPQLASAYDLLLAPATRQLLIYQTLLESSNVHNQWQNELNQLGMPQQCRNIATSNGSECARPQTLLPYSEILRLQGSGNLSKQINQTIRLVTIGAGIVIGNLMGGGILGLPTSAAFAIFSLGNYNGEVDMIVHALPSQQVQNIYHGRLFLKKRILGLNIRLYQYKADVVCASFMLAYDSAPGSFYNVSDFSSFTINDIADNFPIPISRSFFVPSFTFIPTVSALNLGSGNTNFAPQDLTRGYSGAAPPAAPLNTPFANFVTAGRGNESHILWTALNSNWVFNEMQNTPTTVSCLAFCQAAPTINGPATICAGSNSTYSIAGLPPGTQVSWRTDRAAGSNAVVSPAGLTNSSTFTTTFTSGSPGRVVITATLVSLCGTLTVSRTVDAGVRILLAQGATNQCAIQVNPSVVVGVTNLQWFVSIANNTSANNFNPGSSVQPTLQALLAENSGLFEAQGGQTIKVFLRGTSLCDGAVVQSSVTSKTLAANGPNGGGCMSRPANTTTFTPTTRVVEAYPNPTPGGLTLHRTPAPGNDKAPLTVRLYDAYSRVRWQGELGATDQRVSTQGLPPGMYFLHVVRKGEVLDRQQIEVQP